MNDDDIDRTGVNIFSFVFVVLVISLGQGYFVSTVGLDEDLVRDSVRNQKKNDAHRDQLKLGV